MQQVLANGARVFLGIYIEMMVDDCCVSQGSKKVRNLVTERARTTASRLQALLSTAAALTLLSPTVSRKQVTSNSAVNTLHRQQQQQQWQQHC